MFLPVYSDVSQWGKGVVYFGITGPLSLIGIAVIFFSGLPLLSYFAGIFRLNFRKYLWSLEKSAQISALENILLLTIMSSVFLNSDFGVNLTVKELRIGIILGFTGVIGNFVGYYLSKKINNHSPYVIPTENLDDNQEEPADASFIKLPNHVQDRIHKVLNDVEEKNPYSIPKKQIIDRSSESALSSNNYNLRMDL